MTGHVGRLAREEASINGLLAAAKSARDARRQRERIFGHDLLTDPCWDLLLNLFIAGEESHSISVASACLAAPVTAETALRCIAHLTEAGLVSRHAGPGLPGSLYLAPTDQAVAKLTSYFSRIGSVPDT